MSKKLGPPIMRQEKISREKAMLIYKKLFPEHKKIVEELRKQKTGESIPIGEAGDLLTAVSLLNISWQWGR